MLTENDWRELRNDEGFKRFRVGLALMFAATPPGTAPAESDYRAYWSPLRDLARGSIDRLLIGMEKATGVADRFRPSPGSIRAHAMAAVVDWEPRLPPRKIKPVYPLSVPDPDMLRLRNEIMERSRRAAIDWRQPPGASETAARVVSWLESRSRSAAGR